MDYLKSHPLAAIGLGIVIGLVIGSQLKRLPGVSKLPTA
jgi:ElaB/YqjD/DUF883 family membrane-anchored ribosome-binding protein